MNDHLEFTKRVEAERDSQGRYPGAPAWSGDLHTVSPYGLDQHAKGLVSTIANLTVRWVLSDDRWRVTTTTERNASGIDQLAARLVEVRTELDRRYKQVGDIGDYLNLLCGDDHRSAPWPPPAEWLAPPCAEHSLPKNDGGRWGVS